MAISLDGGTYFANRVEIQQGASSHQVRGAVNTHEATTERTGRVYSKPATHYVAQNVDREVGLRTYGVDRETGHLPLPGCHWAAPRPQGLSRPPC